MSTKTYDKRDVYYVSESGERTKIEPLTVGEMATGAWSADVDAELTGLNAWLAGGGVMLHDRCKNLMRGLVATGIICSPSWVLNQDDDEGEDEHDNEADGLVPCPDCAHTSHPGWYIGLGKRERCDRCSGSEWVGKDEA